MLSSLTNSLLEENTKIDESLINLELEKNESSKKIKQKGVEISNVYEEYDINIMSNLNKKISKLNLEINNLKVRDDSIAIELRQTKNKKYDNLNKLNSIKEALENYKINFKLQIREIFKLLKYFSRIYFKIAN